MQNTQEISLSVTDFNKELLEMLCQENTSNEEENICLISNTKLKDNYISLCCGHTFNYDDIFNEIKYQKKQHHNYETQKLYTNQIKCPYCRTVQNGLLPWYEGKTKCTNVNWPPKYQYKPNKCAYEYLSGKRKGHQCSKACIGKYCPNHEKIIKIRLEKQKQKSKIKNKIKSSNLTYKRLMRKKKAELIQLAKDYGIGFLTSDTKKILSDNILTKHSKPILSDKVFIPIPMDGNLYQNVVITI